MTKLKLTVLQDKRARIKIIDSAKTDAFDFLTLIGDMLKLKATRKVVLEKMS